MSGTNVSTPTGMRYFPEDWDVLLVPKVTEVRAATTAALAANTRSGNIIEADANGALGTIDGVTDLAAGDLLLVQDEVAGLNNGPHKILSAGGTSSKWKMERAEGWDATGRVRAMRLVSVSEGTANGNKFFALTTNNPITLNTTALVFGEVAATDAVTALQTLLASTSNGEGASMLGIEDSGGLFTATDAEGAFAENRTAIDAAEASLVTAEADIDAAEADIDDLEAKTFVRSLTITSTDLTASSTTQAIDIGAALPVGAYVLAASYNLTDAFDAGAGSATACTCQVGWAGSTNAVMAATDVFTGAATEGSGLTTAATTPTAADEKTLQALFTATGDNVDTLTNGSITINVLCLAPVADA